MPRFSQFPGYDRIWRWALLGAIVGGCMCLGSILIGLAPMASWAGRGALFNTGVISGFIIAGAFLGGLLALIFNVVDAPMPEAPRRGKDLK